MTPVRLIVSVDGTSNSEWGSLDPGQGTVNGIVTSVRRIHDMIQPGVVNNFDQRPRYFQGVGTEDVTKDTVDGNVTFIKRPAAMFRSATGAGYMDILSAAYEWCCRNLNASGTTDEIWMFGFSRGAFIVRALASLLQHVGLIALDNMMTPSAFRARFNDQLQIYTLRICVDSISSRGSKAYLPFAYASPKIRFIGVFDTVKAVLPRPVTNFIDHGIPFLDLEQDAPILVQHFRHALALNEGRPPFAPTLWHSNAHSSNTEASYLEAWFFGYHTDVGGGNPRRGLALWPLQWMLAAAIEKGLGLTDTHYKHPILFTGALHTIDMPHERAMKMYDMLSHHAAGGRYRLLLHEAQWYIQSEPRNYRTSFPTQGITGVVSSRVSIHPSAYLQFNISSQFRIQIYEWKWFRNFVRDRGGAIPLLSPWWEAETEKNMLQHFLPIRQMRMLIFGKAGAGKLELINTTFSQHATPPERPKDINTLVTMDGNPLIGVHFSPGFATDSLDTVKKLINGYTKKKEVEDQLHAIWYCIDLTGPPITGDDLKFSSLDFGNIPVTVVLTNEDDMRKKISENLRRAPGGVVTEKNITEELRRVVTEKKKEIRGLSKWSYVPTDSTTDSIKEVLRVTFQQIDRPEIQITHIRAQYASTRMKLALATDQTTRAYAVWKAYPTKSVVFRVAPTGQMTLPEVLMDQILRSFNIRFPGDAKLIQSQVGSTWMKGLKGFPKTMWDTNIPANLILCCMVDTMVILARVMSRGTFITRPARRTKALQERATRSACAWYKRKQEEVHTRITALLDNKYLPLNGSMALFQLGLIEIVDFGLASRSDVVEETADAIVGLGRDVVRGTVSAGLSTLTVGTGLLFGLGHEVRRGLIG